MMDHQMKKTKTTEIINKISTNYIRVSTNKIVILKIYVIIYSCTIYSFSKGILNKVYLVPDLMRSTRSNAEGTFNQHGTTRNVVVIEICSEMRNCGTHFVIYKYFVYIQSLIHNYNVPLIQNLLFLPASKTHCSGNLK